MDPEEGDRGRRRDRAPVDVPRGASHNAAHCEADDDGDVLEERRAEQFRKDDGHEGEEAQADELGRAPPGIPRRTVSRGKPRERRGGGLTGEAWVR